MSFNKWKDEYGLEFEPNYSKETELDCEAAFKAGQQSKQDEVDRIVGIITEAYKSGGNSSVETVYDKIKELLK